MKTKTVLKSNTKTPLAKPAAKPMAKPVAKPTAKPVAPQKNSTHKSSSPLSSGLKRKVEAPRTPAPPPVKTHLSPKQLSHFEDLLFAAKAKIGHNIDNIESQNLGSHKDSSGDLSGYSLHMADVGTDNYDRELALNVAGSEQDIIYQIDEALDRIKNGSYGVCVMFGTPIPTVRLEAIPWTAYSKDAQEKLEKEKKIRS